MADLEAEVPEQVQHELDHLLAPGGLLVRQQEQDIDIRSRRELAPAVAADREHRQTLARRRIGQPEHMQGRKVEDDADHLVHEVAQRAHRDRAGFARLEPAPNLGAARGQGRLQQRQRRPAELGSLPGMGAHQFLHAAVQGLAVDDLAPIADLLHAAIRS
jgi:hypothetical protein